MVMNFIFGLAGCQSTNKELLVRKWDFLVAKYTKDGNNTDLSADDFKSLPAFSANSDGTFTFALGEDVLDGRFIKDTEYELKNSEAVYQLEIDKLKGEPVEIPPIACSITKSDAGTYYLVVNTGDYSFAFIDANASSSSSSAVFEPAQEGEKRYNITLSTAKWIAEQESKYQLKWNVNEGRELGTIDFGTVDCEQESDGHTWTCETYGTYRTTDKYGEWGSERKFEIKTTFDDTNDQGGNKMTTINKK